MYGSISRASAQNAKAQLANSYNQLQRQISGGPGTSDIQTVGSYQILKVIGQGSFGKVYLGLHKFSKTKVVLKSSPKDQPNLVREIYHHQQFRHPHIARLYEIIITERLVWMVLEWCPGNELYQFLVANGRLKQDLVKRLFSQLTGAVAYAHSKNCTHRDLKLENILLDKDNNVKLCDFGFTREYASRVQLETICGTTCYMAPEMLLSGKYYGEAVDVWSLGVILYTLLYGEMPFEEETDAETRDKVLNSEPSYPDNSVPRPAKLLVESMLSKDPNDRPTLTQILDNPYLEEYACTQRSILKEPQKRAFSTKSEKRLLRALRAAHFDLHALADSVNHNRCDSLSALWELMLAKQLKADAKRSHRPSISIPKYGIRRDSGTSNGNMKQERPKSVAIVRAFSNPLPTDRMVDVREGSNERNITDPGGVTKERVEGNDVNEQTKDQQQSVPSTPQRQPDGLDQSFETPNSGMTTRAGVAVANITSPSTNVHVPPPSNPLEDISSQSQSVPSVRSSRSSVLTRTKDSVKSHLKTAMMRLVFVGSFKKRHPRFGAYTNNNNNNNNTNNNHENVYVPGIRSMTSSGNSIVPTGSDGRGQSGAGNINHSSNNTGGLDRNGYMEVNGLRSQRAGGIGAPYNNDKYGEEYSDTDTGNITPTNTFANGKRPISQISNFSTFSQLSQLSLASSLSSRPKKSHRPQYPRRSTSSSISSLVSRHYKSRSSTSSASLKSASSPADGRSRASSPVIRVGNKGIASSPNLRNATPTRKFNESAVFSTPSLSMSKRRSPFAGMYSRRRKTETRAKAIQEDQAE